MAHPHPHLVTVSEPLGVSKRLTVSERLTMSERLTASERFKEHELKKHELEEHKLKEHEPKEHEQLPERSWLNIVVLILAAPVSNTVTRKILTEAIYQADFGIYANLLPPPQRPPLRLPLRLLLRLLDRHLFLQAPPM